jgi:hypothetical protein
VSALAGRRRLAAAALAAVAALALVSGLVCASGDGGPPDGLVRLVPATASVYVHVSTDPDREGDARLGRLVAVLPPAERALDSLAAGVAPGRSLDLERDVRPWLGDEAAYAVVAGEPVLLAAIGDRAGAERLARRLGGAAPARTVGRTRLTVNGETAVAVIGDVLAVGREPAVRAAIDRDGGRGQGLADSGAYAAAMRDRPGGRSLDWYASPEGVRAMESAAAALLDRPGLRAAGATLTAEEDGVRGTLRLVGGAPRDADFEPLLLERTPEDAAAYLGVRSAARLAGLLERLGGAQAVAGVRRFLDDAGVDFDRDLAAPLADELGVAVTPPAGGAQAPVLTLRARTSDPGRTRQALARLQEPLAALLAVPGTVPGFEPATIGGLAASTMHVTPELAPTFAVSQAGVIVSTAPSGLEPPRGTLAAAPAFRASIGQVPETTDSLVFLDLRQLLALGEQTGLTAIPGLGTARDDLARVRAAGLVVTEDPARKSDTTAELFLQIP